MNKWERESNLVVKIMNVLVQERWGRRWWSQWKGFKRKLVARYCYKHTDTLSQIKSHQNNINLNVFWYLMIRNGNLFTIVRFGSLILDHLIFFVFLQGRFIIRTLPSEEYEYSFYLLRYVNGRDTISWIKGYPYSTLTPFSKIH